MKIIVDTNILIAAALRGNKPKAAIAHIIANNNYDWIVSREILEEYKAVLIRPKFKLSDSLKRRWFELIDSATTKIEVNFTIDFPRDKKDAKFLACAKRLSEKSYLLYLSPLNPPGLGDFEAINPLFPPKLGG